MKIEKGDKVTHPSIPGVLEIVGGWQSGQAIFPIYDVLCEDGITRSIEGIAVLDFRFVDQGKEQARQVIEEEQWQTLKARIDQVRAEYLAEKAKETT